LSSSDVTAGPPTSRVLVGGRIADSEPGPMTGSAAGAGAGADGAVPVLVVDDQESIRGMLSDLVRGTDGFRLAGGAASGEAALEAAAELAPRLVIMDLRMPGMDGFEAARLLTARHPGTVVLLVSVDVPDPRAVEASAVAAFLPKQLLSSQRLRDVWRDHGS
jgi:DNA-binding NarL/FixJ family response regulator